MSEYPHKRIFLFIIPNRHTLYLLFKMSLNVILKKEVSYKWVDTYNIRRNTMVIFVNDLNLGKIRCMIAYCLLIDDFNS